MTPSRKVPDTVSGQLRWYLVRCGKSTYRLQQETGVNNGILSRFLRGERGISMENIDILADHLGLHLTRRPD